MQKDSFREMDKNGSTIFGKNLREVREYLQLTQGELARRSGLTPACISQIESGEREPTLTTILKILKVIPVKFERLVEQVGTANES